MGNNAQSAEVANGSISPLTSFTHSDRYRFGSISNIAVNDDEGQREQYINYIGGTDKLASWASEEFSPENTPGYQFFGERDQNDGYNLGEPSKASNQNIKRATYRMLTRSISPRWNAYCGSNNNKNT